RSLVSLICGLGARQPLLSFPTRRSSDLGRPVPDVGLSAVFWPEEVEQVNERGAVLVRSIPHVESVDFVFEPAADGRVLAALSTLDRKSTRLNSSHVKISYAVFCLKKKNQ